MPMEVANEIKQSHYGMTILMEGETDLPFYKRMMVVEHHHFFDMEGKDNVIDTMRILNGDDEGRRVHCIGIVDKDFEGIDAPADPHPDRIFTTDAHDREIMTLLPRTRETLYMRLFSEKGDNKSRDWVENEILTAARLLGCFHLTNQRLAWGMTLKQGEDGYIDLTKFYDKRKHLLPLESILVKIHSNRNSKVKFDADAFTAEIEKVTAENHNDCQLLNGHEVAMLIVVQAKLHGELPKKSYDSYDVEIAIADSYQLDDFKRTQLYRGLIEYEQRIGYHFMRS